jgi:hypothetical protein
MAFILVTVFIDVLGIGIIIPILPELVKDFVGGSTADAGRWFGIIAPPTQRHSSSSRRFWDLYLTGSGGAQSSSSPYSGWASTM